MSHNSVVIDSNNFEFRTDILYGLIGHIKIWGKLIMTCINIFFMTSYANHQWSTFFYQAFCYPHLLPKGGGGGVSRTRYYLKKHCPHEHEILYGIRNIFERPRNIKVSYTVINWLPLQLLKYDVFYGGKC